MAFICDLCGKGHQSGNNVSHANNKTRRVFNPNLQRIRALVILRQVRQAPPEGLPAAGRFGLALRYPPGHRAELGIESFVRLYRRAMDAGAAEVYLLLILKPLTRPAAVSSRAATRLSLRHAEACATSLPAEGGHWVDFCCFACWAQSR